MQSTHLRCFYSNNFIFFALAAFYGVYLPGFDCFGYGWLAQSLNMEKKHFGPFRQDWQSELSMKQWSQGVAACCQSISVSPCSRRITMKRLILSLLVAVAVLVSTASAQAGMFGRLHVLRGCDPCGPVACEPCTPPACEPCTPPACDPCEPACYDNPCARGPFRPFGGFFLGLRSRLALKGCGPCEPCGPPECEPCAPPACDPCEPVCVDPCGKGPFRPFGGFFANAWARWRVKGCNTGCDPCEPVCDPCVPCDPCR